MPFRDRQDAGEKLASALRRYEQRDTIVLALPRGGLPVAIPVAKSLNAALDLLLVRKIGVPFQPEVAMGAILDGDPPVVVRNEDVIRTAHISDDQFDQVKKRELAELRRRNDLYRQGRTMADVHGKTVIVVDDGIATGATIRAALAGLKRMAPRKLVLAVPVAPQRLVQTLSREADEVICLEDLGDFGAISIHYTNFQQLSDTDVTDLLESAKGQPE
jgi:putative phosphoribosyl transferase